MGVLKTAMTKAAPVTSTFSSNIACTDLSEPASFEALLSSCVHPSHLQCVELGRDLLSYPVATPTDAMPAPSDSSGYGYMVFRGRVRLLCQCEQRQRLCSAVVLGAGDFFGIDHLFFSSPFPYIAVAASPCQIARVPYSHLVRLGERQPAFREYLTEQMRRRAQHIFFKRFTRLRSLPSRTLASVLLPRIHEHSIEAGTGLREAISPYDGYFWLRSGELRRPSETDRQMQMGDGWSDRADPIANRVAQTPLQIYQLRFQPWETSELLPVLNALGLTR